ncbi:GNAT family protein [Streptomyces sp. AM 2-1-1]|uniref:GNAT family N-acetyltransferase n=1 Tax=Streptomyces sp. AM 2-1-1 TaxID=3028709 RepID=UPI0023B97879|nr:GNAT family protein [Streptomyces sp. AM 2-1-1]WEH39610.1 GNAT family protein [Streptomyces sp. AM 2-1-1]
MTDTGAGTGKAAAAPESADTEDTEPPRTVCWQGRGITFAPLDLHDAELIHAWRSDPVIAREVGTWPRSPSAVRGRIERDLDDGDRDDFLVLLPDGTPLGHIALTEQNIVDGSAAIMLMLAPAHRGQGYGTAAVDALVDLAFGEMPMYRVEAETHTTNTAAQGVLAKAGFVREGVRRSACLHHGRRHDLGVHALLRAEWEALDRPRSWDLPGTG